MNKPIVLQQDNHEKLKVSVSENTLIKEIKMYFRWRKGNMIERLYKIGSHDYDKFIELLSRKGY